MTFTGTLTTLTASASSAPVDTPVTLSWSSFLPNATCTPSGGSSGDGWTGTLAAAGTKAVTSTAASTVTYSISCSFGYGPSDAQTQITYTPVTASEPALPTPAVTLTASTSTQAVGSPVTLRWTSQHADACTASGGASGDGWSGALLSLSGTMSISESTSGSYSYGITCTGAPPAANAKAEVNFTDTSVTVNGSGGKSGGGAFDPWCLVMLALLFYRQQSAAHTRHLT